MKLPSFYRRSASQKWRFSSTSFTSGGHGGIVFDLWYESTHRQGLEEAKFSKDDWYNLLSISHRYECEGARERSIKEINKLGSPATDVDKIAMAKRFEVEEWLVPSCVGLVEREDPLTFAEADKLGLDMAVLVGEARERYAEAVFDRDRHGREGPSAAQLVKDVLGVK